MKYENAVQVRASTGSVELQIQGWPVVLWDCSLRKLHFVLQVASTWVNAHLKSRAIAQSHLWAKPRAATMECAVHDFNQLQLRAKQPWQFARVKGWGHSP